MRPDLWSPLSGWNPLEDRNGVFIQLQNGVALHYLILDLDFGWQTLKGSSLIFIFTSTATNPAFGRNFKCATSLFAYVNIPLASSKLWRECNFRLSIKIQTFSEFLCAGSLYVAGRSPDLTTSLPSTVPVLAGWLQLHSQMFGLSMFC